MRVAATEEVTADGSVRRIDLVAADSSALPSFVPGSHVVVQCGTDTYNAYSLVGEPRNPDRYSVAVLAGDGGSRWMHDRVSGDTIEIDSPRSTFAPVLSARKHLLVAGGIGITPILSLARWTGPSAEAHYVHRPGRGAFADELRGLCDATVTVRRSDFLSGLTDALTRQPIGTHLYVCGPLVLIDGVLALARAAGWPESRLHSEAFASLDAPRREFVVDLRRSGLSLSVAANQSLLDVLDAANVPVDRQCRHGVCGRCRTTVVSGTVEHRDVYLSDDERAHSESMMVCVSRSVTDRLEVDL